MNTKDLVQQTRSNKTKFRMNLKKDLFSIPKLQVKSQKEESLNHEEMVDKQDCLQPDMNSQYYSSVSIYKYYNEFYVEDDDYIFNIKYIDSNFEQFYKVVKTLGQGCTGIVKKVRKVVVSDEEQDYQSNTQQEQDQQSNTQQEQNQQLTTQHQCKDQEYAVKIINTKRDAETTANIIREYKKIKPLKHRNIIQMHQLLIDSNKGVIYQVMELVELKEMEQLIQEEGPFSEKVAKIIFLQILQGIQFLHENGVCHRDIKPQNILCDRQGKKVKITDFNVSKFCTQREKFERKDQTEIDIKMFTNTGTPAFKAPEMLNGSAHYNQTVDIWSAGVTLYIMIASQHPFFEELLQDTFENIINEKYQLNIPQFKGISDHCIDLIHKCLKSNPVDRISPQEAIKHDWFSNITYHNKQKTLLTNSSKKNIYNGRMTQENLNISKECRLSDNIYQKQILVQMKSQGYRQSNDTISSGRLSVLDINQICQQSSKDHKCPIRFSKNSGLQDKQLSQNIDSSKKSIDIRIDELGDNYSVQSNSSEKSFKYYKMQNAEQYNGNMSIQNSICHKNSDSSQNDRNMLLAIE